MTATAHAVPFDIDAAAKSFKERIAARLAQRHAEREEFRKTMAFREARELLLSVTVPLELDSRSIENYPDWFLAQNPTWAFLTAEELRRFVDVFNDTSLPGANASQMEQASLNGIDYFVYSSFGLYVTVMLGERGTAATFVRNQLAHTQFLTELNASLAQAGQDVKVLMPTL